MVALRPVAAWVVEPGFATAVVGPAYDALGSEERRALAEANEDSFFNVLRSPVDFVEDRAEELLAANEVALERLLRTGRYRPPPGDRLYLYGLRSGDHEQTAVVGDLPVGAVIDGAIRPHERTRSAKEAELAGHLRRLRIQSSPVGLTYRAHPTIDALVAEARGSPPLVELVTVDGVEHRVWEVPGGLTAPLVETFGSVGRAYIVDGHHRVAATLRTGDRTFLSGLVPDAQLRLLPYHRVVAGPLPTTLAVVLDALRRRPGVSRLAGPEAPARAGEAVVGLDGAWYRVPLHPGPGELDVDAAARVVIEPLGGVHDARTDPRLDHVPGAGDLSRVAALAAERHGLAVVVHPPTVEQLVAEADAGRTMPPKSTWFEPKLRSGVFVVRRPPLEVP
jgi:uncharacterized protein (DUF1015 family)